MRSALEIKEDARVRKNTKPCFTIAGGKAKNVRQPFFAEAAHYDSPHSNDA